MTRYDVYANPTASERQHTPCVIHVQNDPLVRIDSRVVIPLRTQKSFGTTVRDLNPLIEVDGKPLVLDTASIASVNAGALRRPVARADRQRDQIMAALDTLFGSY